MYIGSTNYTKGIEVTDVDIVWTEMRELLEKQKDFITMGMQTITRYKSMKIFKKNQASYLNIYLLRYYLMDNKFGLIGNVFSEIVKTKIHDFYLLNSFIQEIQMESEQTDEQKMVIYGVSTLLADYFRSDQYL